jgi:hypothetical protein
VPLFPEMALLIHLPIRGPSEPSPRVGRSGRPL